MNKARQLNEIELAREIATLQHKAGEAGMFKTMHALHAANRTAGFEAAEHIEKRLAALQKDRPNG